MDLTQYYNSETVEQQEASGDFDPIPAGWYDVSVERAEVRDTKAGGSMLALMLRVEGPSHAGRVLWANYNLAHPTSTVAVEIGHAQLKALHTACGIPALHNTDQLIGGRCAVRVSVKRDEQWGDKNEVKGARALTGGAPSSGRAPAAPPSVPPAGPPRGSRPPGPPAGPPRAAISDDEVPF
jgi:hypothetical protein